MGQALYADQPTATTPSLANAPSTAATGSQQVANSNNSTNPTPDTSVPVLEPVTANGQITAKQIDNQGSNAIITANGGMDVTTQTLTNTDKSSIAVNGLQAANSVDNQNSRIQLDTLNWQLSQFNNAQGQIVSKQGIHLTSQSPINNAQGVLATLGDARIHSAGAINNSDGVIQGKVTDIRAASLDNSRGTVDAKGNLTLTSQGDLINTQGNISAQGAANITAAGLNNDRGAITATGGLTTQSQNLTNSGQLYGGTGNRLTSGAIDNSGIIGSGGATTITASSLNNTSTGVLAAGLNADGTLSTHKADLIVNTTGALTSRGTHLATGKFSLTGNPTDLAGSTTQAGEISLSSDGDLSTQGAKLTATETMTLNAKGTLNNQNGELAANTLKLTANALDNRHGNITQAGTSDLSLNLPGGLNNQDGVIATNSQNLTINTADLNNQTGNIQHAGSGNLLLTASRVNNSRQGSLLSLGEQTWQIAGDINNSDNQQRGGIQGKRFDITANNLNNDNGVVAALSAASTADSRLDLTGTLANTNKAAVYASNGSLAVTASDINNAGQISSRDQLTTTSQRFSNTGSVYAGGNAAITNQGQLTNTAMMAAGNQLTLDTGSLTQTATGQLIAGLTPDGKLSTLPAHLTITSRDAQSNAGLNLATGDLTVSGAALNYTGSQNQAQTIALTAKTGDITLSGAQTQAAGQIAIKTPASLVHDSLDATHKAVMQADRFAINAGNVSNQGGTINQTGSADFTIHTGNFNNQGGQLGGNASNLNVTATGIVNNQDGALIHTGSGDMRISGASVNNTRGQLITNRGLTLTSAGTVTNDAGVIQAAQATITTGQLTNQAINSQGGKILTSQGDLTVTGSVNSQGSDSVIQSANDLTVNGGTITNSNGAMLSAAKALTVNADALNNDKALIVANQAMAINAGSTTNSGSIGSVNDAVTIAGGSVNNNAGEIAAKRALTINAGNANLTNQTGQLMGHTTSVTAAVVDNSDHGLVLANQDLTVNAGTISNSDTKQGPDTILSQGLIAGGDATLTAAVIDNSKGQVVAGNAATLNVSQTLNNANGRIESNRVQVNGNANVYNRAGSINGYTQADVTAKSLVNTEGQLRAPTLNVALTDSFTHEVTDKLEADDLSLTTQGEFINQGKLAAAKRLAVTAQNIDNQKDASLESGDLTELNATNNIQNRGLINGTKTYLAAGNTLNNLSYGRIYGDHVAIKADTLNNTPEGDGTPAPVIAARQQLDIGVKHLNNNPNPDRANKFNSDFNGQAQIISNGDLNIGGDLDANYMATGKADSVINRGATIESLGDMQINTHTFKNDNADWQVIRVETARKDGFVGYSKAKDSTVYPDDRVEWSKTDKGLKAVITIKPETPGEDPIKLGEDWYKIQYNEVTLDDKVATSDPARMVSGQNLLINGDNLASHKSQITSGDGFALKAEGLQNDLNTADGQQIKRIENGTIEYHTVESKATANPFGGFYKHVDKWHGENPYLVTDKILKTYELPILNAAINTIPTGLQDGQKATVDSLNRAINALNTLKQSTQSASNQTGSADNHAAAKQDALKLLADFAKANPDNLTADQQKQLSDILAAQKDGKGVSQAQLNGLIDSLSGSIKSQYTEEVRATGNGPTLPNSSLYNIDPNNPNGYLVETDPAFANYKTWLSSDYMMQRLGLDPSNMHKRLGDGYYEQGLIRDQVMTLTGRRFLGDYTTDDAMYQALMDNGVATAKAINLRPGIALTAEQMAQLTTDIVWLVEQTITLKDGSKQTVLVPKVYVRSKVGDLKGDGSLIAARNMDMQLTGDLSNQGNIVAHNGLRIQANNLNNQNGGVIQGNFVQVNTKNDLNNLGATLKANSAMTIDAGGKLNNSSTTYHTESQAGQSNAWRTGIDQVGQIYVGDGLKGKTDDNGRPLTTLSIDVGGNATFNAGQLINQGGTSRLVAQGDVALNAVNTGFQTNAIGDSNNYYKVGQTQDVGSILQSLGSTAIISEKGSITGMAANIASADGMTYLKAAKDIAFNEGRATSNLETASKTTEKSLLSRKTTQDRYSQTSDEAIQSNIEGNTVVMDAGHDIHLTAIRAVSDSGIALTAGSDVTIDAAQNRYRESSSHNEKKSGIFGANSGIGFTIGSQKQSMDNQRNVVNHTGSTVGAIDGNVVINAGNHYQQTASDVVAGMGADTGKGIVDTNRGNIDITAKSADIVNATATEDSQSQQKFKQTGLSVSVSNGLVDQYNSINGLVKAGENADSDRMKAMAGISAGLKAQNAIKGVAQAQDPVAAATSGRIQATLGSQSSQSTNQSHTQTNEASTVNAAGNFSIEATGAGKDSNINVIGSQLKAGNNGSLSADNEVNILASSQQDTQTSQNKAQGFGVGVYATGSASGKTGAGITLNANASRGSGDGESTHYTNSQIDVGNTFSLSSGGDTNIRGGVINAKRAEGSVGGNLNIESMQNKETYQGKQRSVGINADIDMVGGNSTNLSVNGGKTNVNSDYVGVNQQSGIFTGDGGFNINVEGKTTLTGGAITTTDKAKQQGLNQFTSKGGIETVDLENHARYEGNAIQAGFALNGSKATQDPQKVDPNLKTSWNGKTTGIGYGKAGDNQTSVTKAGITGIAGHADITTDNKADFAGNINNSFDNNKIMQQLGSQTQITQAFGQEAPKAIGDYAKEKTKPYEYAQMVEGQLTDALTKTTDPEQRQAILSNLAKVQAYKQQHEQDYNNWKEGGAYRVAAHTAIGALGGGTVQSALTAGGTAAAAPMITEVEKKIADNLAKQGIDATTAGSIANSLTGLTLTGIGASAGLDMSSTATAVNIDANNRQLHPKEQDLAKILYEKAKKQGLVRSDGKPYTLEQFKDALRLANSKKYGETYISNISATINANNSKNAEQYLYDGAIGKSYNKAENLWIQSANPGYVTFTQNLNSLDRPDKNLVSFIQKNAATYGYTWEKDFIKPYQEPKIISTTPKPRTTAKQMSQGEIDNWNSLHKELGHSVVGQTAYEVAGNEKFANAMMTTVDVISFATGAGEVYQAVKLTGKGGKAVYIAVKDYIEWQSKKKSSKEIITAATPQAVGTRVGVGPISSQRGAVGDLSTIFAKPTNGKFVGDTKNVTSHVPQANTTVELTQANKLANGVELPKGTVITQVDNGFKATLPNGQVIRGSAKELQMQNQISYIETPNLQSPANSRRNRADLEASYDEVLSSTIPPYNAKNVKLAGQRHPVTGIVFDNKGYPIFDDIAKYDTVIPADTFRSTSYTGQMSLATKDLDNQIKLGNVSKSQFTDAQLKAIESGKSKIPGYTWHHHQDTGRMQLVPTDVHKKTGHIGGEKMDKGQ